MDNSLDDVGAGVVARSRCELVAAVALFANAAPEDAWVGDELKLPEGFARNDAERAILDSLTLADIAGANALAAVRVAQRAETCALKQKAYAFAAGCVERIERTRPDVGAADLAASLFTLARRYGASRTPPRRQTPRTAPRSRRPRSRARARAPTRRRSTDDSEPPPLGLRFLAALAGLCGGAR